MSSLLLSVEEEHLVRIDVRVDDMEWYAEYDRLEVHRSTLSEGGPYEELTAPTWQRARLPATATEASTSSGPLANVDGLQLLLQVGETHNVLVVFTGGPLTHAEAALQIAAAAGPLLYAYVDTNSRLAMQTQALGGIASLRVIGGDAAPLLGLEAGSVGFGADPRPTLAEGRSVYRVTDYFSKTTYFYKTRFSNTSTGAKSDFSQPFSAKAYVGVNPSNIVRGFVRLVQRNGKPSAKQEVTIYAPVLGQQVDGATISGGKESFLTDSNGLVEVDLIRGMVIDVGIASTSLMRHVTVPTDPRIERFDMLSPDVGTDDVFTVKRIDQSFAERRNF